MHIILVRHGESEYNKYNRSHPDRKIMTGQLDTPLTTVGRTQAQQLGQNQQIQKAQLVYSSPLSRAFETAQLATQRLDIQKDDRLLERSLGQYEGRTAAEIEECFKTAIDPEELKHSFVNRAPEGESYADVEQRVLTFLREVEPTTKSLVLFSHVCCLRLCAKILLGLSEEKTLDLAIPNATPLVLQGVELGHYQMVRVT